MAEPRAGYRQVFDARAAFVAGIVGIIVFALTMMGLDAKFSGSPWVTMRSAASLFTGEAAFTDINTFSFPSLAPGLLTYMLVGMALAFILSLLLHRFGLVAGIVGGAILGFSAYVLLYFVLLRQLDMQELLSLKRWTLEVGHAVFGAVVGGVYEWLERARYTRSHGGF